jgi:hypothetical protein
MPVHTPSICGLGLALALPAWFGTWLAPHAAAQVPIQIQGFEEIEFFDDSAIVQMMAAAQAVAPTSAEKPAVNSARLERLKKLEFDRRPSSILTFWAKPPVPPVEPKTPESSASKPAGPAAESAPASQAAPEATVPASTASAAPIAETAPASQPGGAAPAGDAASTGSESRPSSESQPTTTEEQKKQEQQAEADAKKAADEEKKKAEAEKKAAEAKALEDELALFQRRVALGDWEAVRDYLKGLPEAEAKAGYERLLQSLVQGPQQRPQNIPPQGQMYLERNRCTAEDVLGLALAAPLELAKDPLVNLGALLRQALDSGSQIEGFLALVRPQLALAETRIDKRKLARILVHANEPLWLGEFLPTLEDAEKASDREGLNLLARHYLAQNDKLAKVTWLEQAWRATQSALTVGEISEDDKNEALRRSVDLAPKLRDEFGSRWLDESFTARPERGIEILAAIGSSAATALQTMPTEPARRLKLLELQTTAAKALIQAAPERARDWKSELGVLAGNWLREAQVTYQLDESGGLGPRMQRDNWGNMFFYDWSSMQRGNGAQPVATDKILDIRPSEEWLALLDAPVRPRYDMLYAQLYLKAGEEALAFPHIERLASQYPRQTKDLADEFLRVWSRSHDPNSERRRTNSYMFMYGFEERANGIPLTRSKQERNLKELGEWVKRLRTLAVDVDETLLANAFTTSHSSAEVYRLETIEAIFGSFDTLEPTMLAELLEKMRENLSKIWRDPAGQEDKKTKRKQQDIQAEVLRGYELAHSTLDRALAQHPQAWQLVLVQAELAHDENDYRADAKKDPEYSKRRQAAFEEFARAASLYASVAQDLELEKRSTRVYENWFYAALGASDLGAVDHRRQLAQAEIPRIRTALHGLPEACNKHHVEMFASALSTRISNVAPAAKLRYVREGLAISGEHTLVKDVQEILSYYGDLVTEIQLRAEIDGSSTVGHARPFGLQVDLRHTKDIERESGGFAKYLQNQNSANFGWNYGRPLEDYRDKFEEAARSALEEHFSVVSITFNDPKARSRAEPEYGWRVTPYAYVLLKPKGPQVDKIPALRMDLDFLDTSGYVVLPIESQPIPIDARSPKGDPAPWTDLALTQTLDERQFKSGKLIVEVKATAKGLVPDFDALFDPRVDGFDVVQIEDPGVSISRFEEDSAEVISERVYNVTLKGRGDLAALPTNFTFWKSKLATKSEERFRYQDADLLSVPETVKLEQSYGDLSRAWLWWIPVGLGAAAGLWWLWRSKRKSTAVAARRFQLSEPLTPFTVIGLLRDIERQDGLVQDERGELSAEIARLEQRYFGRGDPTEVDLRAITERWTARWTA